MKQLHQLFPVIVILIAGCTQSSNGGGTLAVGQTMTELASASDLIVVGTILQATGTRNLARQVGDATQEANDVVVLGQDYTLRVETALKGGATSGSEITVSLAKWHGVRGQTTATDPGYTPFTVGASYALFLKPLGDNTGAYGQGLEPFRFRVEGLSAHPESKWAGASARFPDQSLTSLIVQIRTALK